MASFLRTAPFTRGQKELYFPDFTVILVRTRGLSPNFARFHVPLWFNKLDLRDYLWHVYNVQIHSCRSAVQQMRVQQGPDDAVKPQPRRWFRPPAKKFMTVELAQPFVYPEPISDLSAWNPGQMSGSQKASREMQESLLTREEPQKNKKRIDSMRSQAKRLLRGRVKWASPNHTAQISSRKKDV